MILEVYLGDDGLAIEIEEAFLAEAAGLFDKMDADMDAGWQMGREWVDAPEAMERCQIVADRLLGALERRDELMIKVAAAYILQRMPGVAGVSIDMNGEMGETRFFDQPLGGE